MFSRHPALSAGIAVFIAALAFTGVASAAGPTRYAAPGGLALGTCTTPATACTLPQALLVAAATADEVVVTSGDYDLGGSGLNVAAANNVHGVDGQPRPLIHGTTNGATPLVNLATAGATLRRLSVRQDGTGSGVSAPLAASLADLTLTNTAPGGSAARLGTGVVMAGSTALATGGSGIAIDVAALGAPVLHNITAWASGGVGTFGIRAPVGAAVTGTNSIVRAPGGSDTGGGGLFNLATSNVGGAPAPLLANPAGGDFHELSGSPTIDAGVPDPLAGLTDIDGDARILGALQDIGADEFISHRPAVTTGIANGATVTGTVVPNGLPTTYRFDFGPTPLYGSSTSTNDAGSGTNQLPVNEQLSGLTPGTIVHYRVVAVNADGESAGLDRVLIAPGPAPRSQQDAPHFTSLSAPVTATVGQPVTISAAGKDRNDPVNSIQIDFDDGAPGFFAESACRLRPKDRAFRDGRLTRFDVPYTFSNPGVHTIRVTLGSGTCGKTRQRTIQTTQITVVPAAKRLARVRAGLTAAADCPNADAVPSRTNVKAIESATLCLLNEQRRANGLGGLRRNKKLRSAAQLHTSYMIQHHFFAHQGPGELSLAQRFRRVRYRGGGGENLGVGVGLPYATPRSMVSAWMNSPLHRANILERAFHTIGITVVAAKPIPPPPLPGATYTTEFGTTRR